MHRKSHCIQFTESYSGSQALEQQRLIYQREHICRVTFKAYIQLCFNYLHCAHLILSQTEPINIPLHFVFSSKCTEKASIHFETLVAA